MPTSKGKRPNRKGGRWKTSPIWRQWDKECKSYTKFLKKLRDYKTMGSEKWREKMKEHYTKRLAELQSNEPKKYL